MNVNPKDQILVSIQFLLFLVFTVNIDWSLGLYSPCLKNCGLIVSIFGLIIILLSVLQLNKNLSPFPTPKNNAVLVQNGLFKLVRHPIYSGIILVVIGYSVYKDSLYKGIISMLLLILFHFKTKYEEQKLSEKFPNYQSYKKKTGKFFPRLFSK